MAQSFSSLYVHVVYSTKDRVPLLTGDLLEKMHAYTGGTINNTGCQCLTVGGVADHLHFLARISRTLSMADFVREVKASTSKWAKEFSPGFTWQSGYGAFSVGHRELPAVRQYIETQAEHHKKFSFQEEFLNILREHDLEWDDRYIWD